MSVSLWDYSPEKCDGDYCPGDCDLCNKETSDGETEMINYINADELKIENIDALEGWVSPVEIIYEDAKNTFLERTEEQIMARVESTLGVKVDRDELIKAMSYDREQYRKGFENGYKKRDAEIVRCKDCIHWLKDNKPSNKPEYRLCEYYRGYKNQDGYCDFGERIETE